tara:strand:+ start:811 stop:1200 length:390 start_codon:yes stop_codon:yes gene_type:complete
MIKKKQIASNRSFGLVFFIVLMIISLWSFRGDLNDIKIIPFILSIFFLILGLLNSKFLTPLNYYWIKFGELLGKIISPVVMGFVYFLVVTPIAIIIRLFGKDLLSIKFSKMPSYWTKRQKNIGSMKKQF